MLETILSTDEYSSIPSIIIPKIDDALRKSTEQYITEKALFETYKRTQEETVEQIKENLSLEIEKKESITSAYEKKCNEFEELENKIKTLEKQNLQFKRDIIRHENESRTYRLQRDETNDEKSSLQAMLTRRTEELNNLKADYDSVIQKLNSAVQAKIEALSLLDEIQTKKIELDFKEKRLDKERELLTEQINLLTNDVTKYNKDLVNIKREHTSQVISLQTHLQERNEEVKVLLENEENLKKTIQNLNEKIEELNDRLTGQSEMENQLQQKYIDEIESRQKLVEVYKEMCEESNKKSEELTKTSMDLQKLLLETSDQYKDLERRFIIDETTYKEHLIKKNETIAALKKELVDANNLIDVLKRDHLNETIENLSPQAAAACNMIQKNLTLTQIYTEYATVTEQLLIKNYEYEHLQNTFKSFMKELESKSEILRKKTKDYNEAVATIQKFSQNSDQLEADYNIAKEKHAEAERNVCRLTRDKERLQKTISDLGRQVCFLLKELEESRGAEISMMRFDESGSGEQFSNSSDVISKKLVTFHDIEELQETNQKLLAVVRDLSEELENAENKFKECKKEELEEKIKHLENTLNEKIESSSRQEKIIQMFKSQVKMYQIFNNDSPKSRKRLLSNDMDITDFKDVVEVSVQTDIVEIENLASSELKKELNASKKELAELKLEFENCQREHSKNEKMFLQSLEKAEQNNQKISQRYKKIISQSEISEEKCKCLSLTIESLKAEIKALENRCKTYSQTIAKHEQSLNSLREEAMNAIGALTRNEVLLENSKRECMMLRESEARIKAERDMLQQDKQSHAHLLTNLESIKASIDRSESEWKYKMEEKLDASLKECSALRRRLQDEQDRYVEKISLLEQMVETMRNRLEEEKKYSSESMNMTNSLKLDLNEKNKTIEKLEEKLKNASSKSVGELELLIKNLQNKYQLSLRDVEHQKDLQNAMKKDVEEITKLSENFEKQLISERDIHLKYKRETEIKISEMAGEIAGLQKQNAALQKRVNDLSNLNQTSMINLNDELIQEKRKHTAAADELNLLKQQLATVQNDLNAATEAKFTAEKKYADEMLQHSNDIKELQYHINEILELKKKITILTNERDTALIKAESVNTSWKEEEKKLKQEIDTRNEKLNDIIKQNELLLNEIQEISLKVTITQNRDSYDEEQPTATGEIDGRATDNLLQVITFLRREKNLAVRQLQALSSENMRLKSEIDLMKLRLEETQNQLKVEQNKTDISSTTAAKHAELISKVQTLNALIDSNRVLREERDRYAAELSDIKQKLEQIESEIVVPLQNENKQLTAQLETLQIENTGLQRECALWRNRVTEMTEKMNRTNSEDIKDLKKSLNVEREAYNKTLDDLRAVKQEKSKLEEQIKKLQFSAAKIPTLEKERNDLQKELSEVKAKQEKISQEFGELQKNFSEQEEAIARMKSSNLQLKSIARKYKSQWLELTEENKELKTKLEEAHATPVEIVPSAVAEIPVLEQNRLRQEGKQQMETEMNDRIKHLTDQLTANQVENEKLVAENKGLEEKVNKEEVRNAAILQQARSRILILASSNKKFKEERKSYEERLQTVENAMREEATARENVVKSSYENRLSKMEKEKTEMQTERDRLLREIEVLSQRINTLQRQLHSQQGVKSNVNSSQEKSNTEPPTANIKPMAGPSSSVTKSQQSQQSVAVTPWRSANETPLASIRPMSLQTRTAAVLPTSQTSSCSTSQSTVMVPPQQQMVDTSSNAPSIVEAFSSSPSSSSHTDYNMPSTSSSVSHTSVRQVVVTPTQQTSHSAESTQDMEVECGGNQELSSQASVSGQQQSSQASQNQANVLSNLSQIIAAPTVSQSQTPTVALVLPRIDLQNIAIPGSSHLSNTSEQSVVASSQTNVTPLVSASNQSDQKRTETYYQQDGEDSNLGLVSASNQHSQQQAVVASSIETAPEQSIVIASSQQSYDKTLSEPSVASSNANSSNTVTTTQAGLKRPREAEGESSKSTGSTEIGQPQTKRNRRVEQIQEDLFRGDIDESSNADMLLRYGGLDVEYQVPTSSQRDQEFDNLVIDSEADDELEEDEQTMPDDGIIDENEEYVEDEDEVEGEVVYEVESYDREDQDAVSYNVIEGPDIDEEGVQVQDQGNEVEILDDESNEVPNQSGRSDTVGHITTRRNLEQQSSEATSSGNNLRAQSASITSNQSSMQLQFSRRPSIISPLNRQQNQQLLLPQGYEENTGDDSIVPSTPTLCVPRRTDGFGEAVSSPHVPSGGRFIFAESNPPTSRAAVAQMVSEGIDDTRMDLSQLEETSGTGRSVPTTPLQSSPQDTERIEVGQSVEDSQLLNEELTSNTNQGQQPASEDILIDTDAFRGESTDNELEVTNESENLIDEPSDTRREENNDSVTSEAGQSETPVAGPSQTISDDLEEGREAEAATKNNDHPKSSPQPIPTTGNTARRSGSGARMGRPRGTRSSWTSHARSRSNELSQDSGNRGRGSYRGGRKPKQWYYNKRYQ